MTDLTPSEVQFLRQMIPVLKRYRGKVGVIPPLTLVEGIDGQKIGISLPAATASDPPYDSTSISSIMATENFASSWLIYGKATFLTGDDYNGTFGGKQYWLEMRADGFKDFFTARLTGHIDGQLTLMPFAALPAGERVWCGVLLRIRAAKSYDWENGGTFGGTYTGDPQTWPGTTGFNDCQVMSSLVEVDTVAGTINNFSIPVLHHMAGFDWGFRSINTIAFRSVRVNVSVHPFIIQSGSGAAPTIPNFYLQWWHRLTADAYPPQFVNYSGRGESFGLQNLEPSDIVKPYSYGLNSRGEIWKSAVAPTLFSQTAIPTPAYNTATTSTIDVDVQQITAGSIAAGTGSVTIRLDSTGATTTTALAGGRVQFTGLAPGNYEIYKSVGPDSYQPPSIRVYVPGDAADILFWDDPTDSLTYYANSPIIDRYAAIGGTVSGLGGTPCRVVCWKISDLVGSQDQGPVTDTEAQQFYGMDRFCCMTDASGVYRFTGLPPGTYRVELDPSISGSYSPASYTGVVAGAGSPVTGKDFA